MDTPSAVSSMLAALSGPPPAIQQTPSAGLLGGGPMPALLASQQPQAPPPMSGPPPEQNMLGKVHDWLQSKVVPDAPAGYEGLLSPAEIKSARPGLLQSLIGTPDAPSPSERYRSNLDGILKMHQVAKALREETKNTALRQEVGSVLGNTKMAPEERFAALTKLLGVAFQMGDDKVMGAIANAMQTAKPPVAVPKQYEPKAFTLGGKIVWVKPGEPVPPGATPFHAPPQQGEDRTLVQVEGPEGPVWMPRAQAVGMPVKKSGATGTAQNAASEALLRASVGEMHNADSFMREYENDLASGRKSINGLAQFMGGVGNSFTHDDPASRAIQNTALTALNTVNPDLARYIRRGLSFAEGESGISKRPSDFRTKMAAFLSTAASGASPEMIRDIQGRRSSILTPLHDVVGKMVNPKGSGSVTVKKGSALDAYRHLLK